MMKNVSEGQNHCLVSLLGCVINQKPLSYHRVCHNSIYYYGDLLSYLKTNSTSRMVSTEFLDQKIYNYLHSDPNCTISFLDYNDLYTMKITYV